MIFIITEKSTRQITELLISGADFVLKNVFIRIFPIFLGSNPKILGDCMFFVGAPFSSFPPKNGLIILRSTLCTDSHPNFDDLHPQ